MVSAVVVADFTVNGVTYQKGQKITVPESQYNEWAAKNWVVPGGEPTVTNDWVVPGSDGD